MGRSAKSQWEFGDLFDKGPVRQVWSVAQITTKIRSLLETELGAVWVTGEATNIRVQSSGHTYFTLKDSASQLSCVLFRADAPAFNRDHLKEGIKLTLKGELTVYEARGQYQLIVSEVELQGQGALQIAFEQLKAKLQAEGLFDAEGKRPIPTYPQRIGIVTSPTGAALQDVLHVLGRRHPALELILRPVRVQGEGAADEMAYAIVQLNAFSASQPPHLKLDCILLTRGGGSLEDLWAFNEETLARAIHKSELPIISAVGHEIDFTISDFVADLRAATPSAAAEILTNGIVSARQTIAQRELQMARVVRQCFAKAKTHLAQTSGRLARLHPRRKLQEQAQTVDDLHLQLQRCTRKQLRDLQIRTDQLAQRLLRTRPTKALARRHERLEDVQRRFSALAAELLEAKRAELERLRGTLDLLSPKAILQRGYSITRDAATGAVIRSPAQTTPNQEITTLLAEGEVTSRVLPSTPL
ncbi:MAG TPA: exodeoxyribonuclease VII large subunit [Methylomirabilota bacterium]|nr:exodeoxyribonuclease VII large subunit [Methylomirabilota bacterium]